ncbi:MAG: TetR family transcriptional regulator, partial [Desulfobulbus sp.]|nr:TetR family transcriptional regulator [Desulfobulbus sp.]
IAREAGVTRGAIYWHFTNKADLLNALWDEVLLLYTPLARASESRDEPDPLGRLREVYVRFLGRLADDPRQQQLIRILFDQGSGSEDIDLIRTRHLQTLHQRNRSVQTVLRNAIDRGQLSPDLDVRLGTIAVVSFIHGLIANWVLTPDMFDIKGDAPALIEGLLQMLRTMGRPAA